MGASLWLKSKVFRMTIILQDPSTHEPYEVETIQIEKPVEKKAGVKNQTNLVYVFLVLIVVVIIAAVAVATTTLPQEPTTTTTTTTTTPGTTLNTTTTPGMICPGNCYAPDQGWCNETSGICTCNQDVPGKFCGIDCNSMYQYCMNNDD